MADTKISALSDGTEPQSADEVPVNRGGVNYRVPMGKLASGVTVKDYLRFPATQVPSAGANDLDDYEEGTFSPGLTLGGGNTGMTFGTQSGYYTKIGDMVFFELSVVLTAVGSSTGSVLITGLPFTANASGPPVACAIRAGALQSTVGGFQAQILPNSTTIAPSYTNTGVPTTMTHANLLSTAGFNISGCYKV